MKQETLITLGLSFLVLLLLNQTETVEVIPNNEPLLTPLPNGFGEYSGSIQ